MNLYIARFSIGLTVLLAHLAAVVIYLTIGASVLPDPQSNVAQGILTIAPIFGFYAFTFVKYVTAEAIIHDSDKLMSIGLEIFFVQYFVIFLFCFLLICGQVYILLSWTNVEDVKVFTASMETAFGVMIARIFERLFPSKLFESRAANESVES